MHFGQFLAPFWNFWVTRLKKIPKVSIINIQINKKVIKNLKNDVLKKLNFCRQLSTKALSTKIFVDKNFFVFVDKLQALKENKQKKKKTTQ